MFTFANLLLMGPVIAIIILATLLISMFSLLVLKTVFSSTIDSLFGE